MANGPRNVDDSLDGSQNIFAQLMQDVNDVFVAGVKKLDSFPPDYQEKLKSTYRFYGIRYGSNENFMPKITPDTHDLV
jgi:hypothetical protein